ncbi:P-loop containing nucleoside triphosphate hydrolase protein [Xylariales sp. AK1849]|nr:P-loop containing nucleoside triphosphate hydrolase protein [Xylariales sp. AK1849]
MLPLDTTPEALSGTSCALVICRKKHRFAHVAFDGLVIEGGVDDSSSKAKQHSWLISRAAGISTGFSVLRLRSPVSWHMRSRSDRSMMYWRTSSWLLVPTRAAIPGRSSLHFVAPICVDWILELGSTIRWAAAAPVTATAVHPFQQVHLRDYQEECIQSVLSSLALGHKRLGISLATGAGKTVIFTQLIDRIKPMSNGASQTLILAHRRELVEQAARHCTSAYPGKTVDIEMGNMHASGAADITIASVQSITSGDRISKFNPKQFKLVLVDEAHHIVAPGYLRTLEHFALDKKRDGSPALVGVSATFSRFDGLRLGAAIDEIVYHKDYVDMIGEQWLSDVVFTTVESTADISRVRSGANGDFQSSELSRVVNTEQVNEITVRSWLAKANGRRSTLVFCIDLAHVAGLTQTFRNHGVDARYITGDTPKTERGERLEAFKAREFSVLVNCGVFTEGTDIPNIDCVILARPTRSRNLLVQMIGRGMRLYKGKTDCHVIDMVSSLETGIVTTPTLFGLDPSELVSDASLDEMRGLKDRKEAEQERSKEAESAKPQANDRGLSRNVTFTDYDSVFDLIADTSGEKHIRSISQYAWVQVGPDKYILSGPSGTYLRLERDETAEGDKPLFAAWEIRVLPQGTLSKSPFAAPRRLLTATTFSDAVHGSDNYASEKFPNRFISRLQRWRSGPATDGQLKFLNKIRTKDDQLAPADITTGKASDMITKIKHGARGRFASLDADRRKKERQAMLVEQGKARKLREQVSVGPMMA